MNHKPVRWNDVVWIWLW